MDDNPDYVAVTQQPGKLGYVVQRWHWQHDGYVARHLDAYQTEQAAYLYAKAYARSMGIELRDVDFA